MLQLEDQTNDGCFLQMIEDHDELKEREGVVVTYQRDLMVLSDALR